MDILKKFQESIDAILTLADYPPEERKEYTSRLLKTSLNQVFLDKTLGILKAEKLADLEENLLQEDFINQFMEVFGSKEYHEKILEKLTQTLARLAGKIYPLLKKEDKERVSVILQEFTNLVSSHNS